MMLLGIGVRICIKLTQFLVDYPAVPSVQDVKYGLADTSCPLWAFTGTNILRSAYGYNKVKPQDEHPISGLPEKRESSKFSSRS